MFWTWGRLLIAVSAAAFLAWTSVPVLSTSAAWVLLSYLPGRALLRWIGIESAWSRGGRIVLSVAVSWSVVPFFLNPLWHFTHDGPVMLVAVWAAVSSLAILNRRHGIGENHALESGALPTGTVLFEQRRTRVWAWVVGLMVTGAVILPYWPTDLLGYPMPSQIHDFIKHHAILDSLERMSLPLGNIFYADGAEEPVYYYHFFYLIPATVRLWSGHALSIELAYGLGSALVALATTGMVFILTRRFTGSESRAVLAASLVTVIGALDIIPLIPHMLDIGQPVIVMDAWARHEYRIHNVLNQMIWAPQNVTGVLVILVGAYVLSIRGRWWGWLILGPVLGASAVGSSVWVALGALPALGLLVLTRPRWWPGAAAVGVLMAMVSLPLLVGYAESSARHGGSLSADWPVNRYAVFGRLVGPGVLANVLDLPFVLAIEFGARALFLPLVPMAMWRRMWRDDGLRWLMMAACLGLIGTLVFHSNMRFNAFGQRIILLPLLFTSMMASCAVTATPGPVRWWNPLGWRPTETIRRRRTAAALMGLVLVAGLTMGFWEAPLSAVRRYIEEPLAARRRDPETQAKIDAEHAAYRFMRDELPDDAVVQPDVSGDRAILAQIVRRRLGVIGPQEDVMVFDPLNREAYLRCAERVAAELAHGRSAAGTYAVLRGYKITHVFLGTLERERWSHLDRFDDRRFFEDVFRDDGVRVVALK